MQGPGIIAAGGLILRPLGPGDAPAIADGLGRWEVAQWLAVPPWPYSLAHAEDFLASPVAAACHAITFGDDLLRGVISINARQLGYWLHPAAQGQRVMSRAARARVAAHFAGSELSLLSGVQSANTPSLRILTGLGFVQSGRASVHNRIRGHKVETLSLELSQAGFRASAAERRA